MLNLPKTTVFNKRIPKQKFYENLNVTPAIKRCFVEQIKSIYWKNKIATSTTNLAVGSKVTEIEVFEIKLNTNALDESILRQIDKEIPYHMVFLLESEGKYQVWTAYKEKVTSGSTAFKVNRYYYTDWLDETELTLEIEGLNLDVVYENFVRQIAGDVLQSRGVESLKDTVERDEKSRQLKKQIEVLQNKIRKEKQLNVQMKLNAEIKKLKKELEEL